MKLDKFKFLLFIVFLLAVFLRFWQLGSYPEAIDEDEMAFGYYGYSLSNFGTDEYGHRFPIYFESVGDNKYGIYSYFAAVPIRVFGLNNTTTRSVSAASGALSVVLIYFLVKNLTKNKTLSLFSAFVLAVNPIHIHFSRVAYNNGLGGFFAIASFYFFYNHLKDKRIRSIVFSYIFALLSFYTYQTYRIFLPVVLFLVSIIYLKKIIKEKLVIGFLALLIFTVLISFIPSKSRTRAQDFNILINRPKLLEQYTEDGLSKVALFNTRLFHNKYLAISYGVFNRYLSYFDPVFLFSQITGSTERHNIPDIGVFYFYDFVFFIIGIIFLKYIYKRNYLVPVFLILSSPLAASMVVEPRSITRTLILVWGISIVVAIGLYVVFIKWKRLLPIIIILYISGLAYFWHQYFIHKPMHQPWFSDVGHKEMVEAVNKYKKEYKYVVISRGHYMPFIYYNEISPPDLQKRAIFLASKPDVGTRISSIDNIIFNMPYECPGAGKLNVLYVCFGYQVPKNSKVIQVIRFRDGLPAITLVEFGKVNEKLPERVNYIDSDARFVKGILPDDYPGFWPTNE